jgi:hypothetical protein
LPVVVDVIESVELPVPPLDRIMLVGLRVRVGPGGELDRVRVTVPVKLLMLVRVTVEFVVTPVGKVMTAGLAEIVKSAAWGLKNSVIGLAFASLVVKLAKFQLTSIVLVNE